MDFRKLQIKCCVIIADCFEVFNQQLLKVHCSSFFLIFILTVLCETFLTIPISVSFASRWVSYKGAKLQKTIMRERFRFFGLTMLKRRDVT